MNFQHLTKLPDELLEAIVIYLSPEDTIAFGSTCKRCDKVTHEALVWRRHCIQGWKFWQRHHDIDGKIAQPPAQTRWRYLYNVRKRTDEQALAKFEAMLLTQQHRTQRIEDLAALGYDIKDLMYNTEKKAPDHADDALARAYHARIIAAKIHREIAIEHWDRLHDHQMVSLDEALGSYDLFVLAGETNDLDTLDAELNGLAKAIVERIPEFDELSTRSKAIEVATYLRSQSLLGNDQLASYHALRNNYMTLALSDSPHRSLPLQSAAIYCGVARRLGIDAKPSNFPHHVYVVVQPPRDSTLDGRPKPLDLEDPEREYMHIDPWRSSNEVERAQLVTTLTQMGTRPAHYASFLGPSSIKDITLRAGRNIMTSVTEARNRIRLAQTDQQTDPPLLDVERAWYSMLWAMMLLGDHNDASSLSRRRSCLPYLMEHYQVHFPEDLGLLERYILPMFVNAPEDEALMQLVSATRMGDENKKAPSPRTAATSHVKHKVGSHFAHRRYGYTGVVIGWDIRCEAGEQWINQMRVNELPQGREQPFYHILADDKSVRYVAQENIDLLTEHPVHGLLHEGGRYFKRWDEKANLFVSNIVEEYPDN